MSNEKERKTTTQRDYLHINLIAFSVSVGIILYIHTSSIERREKERLSRKHPRRLKAILKKRRSKRKRNKTHNKSF